MKLSSALLAAFCLVTSNAAFAANFVAEPVPADDDPEINEDLHHTGMSLGSEKLIRELWKSTEHNYQPVREHIESLRQAGWPAEKIALLMCSLIDHAMYDANKRYCGYRGYALALTHPELEPNYPINGKTRPAYELFPVTTSNFRAGVTGAALGLSHRSKFRQPSEQFSDLRSTAQNLVESYWDYINLPALKSAYRKRLEEYAGVEAVTALDDALARVNPRFPK